MRSEDYPGKPKGMMGMRSPSEMPEAEVGRRRDSVTPITAAISAPAETPFAAPAEPDDMKLQAIPVAKIFPSPYQMRVVFNEVALEELATSISLTGLIKPLLVRPVANGFFELVGGERRWRAHKMLSKKMVTCIVRELDDEAARVIAITDNEQEDLTDFERGIGYWRMMDDGLEESRRGIARRIGIPHSSVVRCMQFMDLPEWAIDGLRKAPGAITINYVSKFIAYCRDHEAVAREVLPEMFEGRLSQQQALRKMDRLLTSSEKKGEDKYYLSGIGHIKMEGQKIELRCDNGVDMTQIKEKLLEALKAL